MALVFLVVFRDSLEFTSVSFELKHFSGIVVRERVYSFVFLQSLIQITLEKLINMQRIKLIFILNAVSHLNLFSHLTWQQTSWFRDCPFSDQNIILQTRFHLWLKLVLVISSVNYFLELFGRSFQHWNNLHFLSRLFIALFGFWNCKDVHVGPKWSIFTVNSIFWILTIQTSSTWFLFLL